MTSITGSIVALVTPMLPNGALDLPAFKQLVAWHLKQGTHALVITGSTGEGATVSFDEWHELLSTALGLAKGKIPVIAATGSCDTAKTRALTVEAARMGADATLIVSPYYVRPTQEGIYRHYMAIADACALPIIVYNVPSRTASDVLPKTVQRLSMHANIVGVKEATGDLSRVAALREGCRDDFLLLTGDDSTAPEFMKLGGDGVISVVANIIPKTSARMCEALLKKPAANASADETIFLDWAARVSGDPNPIPIKWAMSQAALIQDGIRLPLTPYQSQYHGPVLEILKGWKRDDA